MTSGQRCVSPWLWRMWSLTAFGLTVWTGLGEHRIEMPS